MIRPLIWRSPFSWDSDKSVHSGEGLLASLAHIPVQATNMGLPAWHVTKGHVPEERERVGSV